jgi:hypothetical protein
MPTFTSVKSGYWNDPTVWDQNAVPADGDSVVVAAGHTVIFNVDQSSFTTGLAGLTINGTLKIPSKDEDSSMPDFVCLKVNANIAGSGSFLIGSSTYPITYPQSAKVMVNGTITVATFNAYGEQRSPLWDYLAQDAAAGATTIVLQNGLPLRSGDIIAIGRSDIVGFWSESSSARGLHTVASYNAATKTVTLNEALTHARSGTGVRACLVILLSRQIVISKYGANNVTLLSGSGRTVTGVLFQAESGATAPSMTTATSSSKYINCSLGNAYNPIIQSHYLGVSEIINLSTNAYYRPTLRVPSIADELWTSRIIVKGLTVAGTQHPKAFEHLFPHGYVKNKWDAATPDYTTFDFILTQSSFAGQPLWLEYQVFTSDPIRVTGTITQLGTNESVKVQIFSAGKEPLYGDTPDYEQTYTSTGDISVNWTPTDARTWVVRILAYPQQTTNPITIQNLQVAGGGGDGGGSSPVVGEPAFVFAG